MWISDEDQYETVRQRIRNGDPEISSAAEDLRARAAVLRQEPCASVTDKALQPLSPSSDPRDYVSIATYSWPNPDTPDGLPYISRDGQLCPHAGLYDRFRWDATAGAIVTLIKAAYFLDVSPAAAAAVQRIRTWFTDPETGMHPHLEYAQFWPGITTGRCFGIIDYSSYLPVVLDHVLLLAEMPDTPWTPGDADALQTWCVSFYTWLQESDHGRAERDRDNNHGSFYDRITLSLALFLGKNADTGPIIERLKKRIGAQVEPDGRLPHELSRTCGFGYSLMTARGFAEFARTAGLLGEDLWSYRTGDGRSIKGAVDFLYDFAKSGDEWQYQQIETMDWRMVWPLMHTANLLNAGGYDYAAVAHRMPAGENPDAFILHEPLHMFGKERVGKAVK